MADFLGVERLSLGPWQAFERGVQRLMVHAGFRDVRLVGGSGDEGADVVGELDGRVWIVQAKYRSTGQIIGTDPIDEVTTAIDRYRADVGVVATNTGFSGTSVRFASKRKADLGVPILLWNGDALLTWDRKLPDHSSLRSDPRPYQALAIEAINLRIMIGERSGLLLMATGLGKTRVAAGVIEQWVNDRPGSEVLVLAPTLQLIPQLEAALWPYLAKQIPTHVLTGVEKPSFGGGVTLATYQSMVGKAEDYAGRFGLVIVDEAHHAPADGFRVLLARLGSRFLLGMTATPWRSDERPLVELFGEPTYSVSIVEGMQLGYLARVDYRMLIDDIDWDWVQSDLRGDISIKELNRRLFIPERDGAAVAKIRDHLNSMTDPRGIVFCRSIAHADIISRLLRADGVPNRVVHSRLDRFEATRALREFRSGRVPVVVTVDMLNEGIDVPEVDLIVFMRVTHSRRIFVQQLGRGLRLSDSKQVVRVLDFVSDVRRIAAAMQMNSEASVVANDSPNLVEYPTGRIVDFEGDESLSFFGEYLADVAGLEDTVDGAFLKFPD